MLKHNLRPSIVMSPGRLEASSTMDQTRWPGLGVVRSLNEGQSDPTAESRPLAERADGYARNTTYCGFAAPHHNLLWLF